MTAILRLCAALLTAAGPALAETCPPWQVDETTRQALHEALRAAPDAAAARRLNNGLWEIWTQAPDAEAQDLLDDGMARLRVGDFTAAEAAFTALIAHCPDYAEGYNQRAFAHFLREDYDPALVDLDAALARSPEHIGALSGKALTLMGMGRDAEALAALEAALALNPWLSERSLLQVLKDRLGDRDL